jgi:hypothetical protein
MSGSSSFSYVVIIPQSPRQNILVMPVCPYTDWLGELLSIGSNEDTYRFECSPLALELNVSRASAFAVQYPNPRAHALVMRFTRPEWRHIFDMMCGDVVVTGPNGSAMDYETALAVRGEINLDEMECATE